MAGHANRAHALLSASSAERWIHCPASAKLAEKYPKQDTPFTLEGTEAHELAEACVRRLVLNEPPVIDTECDQYNEDMWRHGSAYAEYISGLCTADTTVMVEQRVDFSPWVPEGFGTADCILLTGDTMDVIDYKYGQGVAVSAVENPQMQLYGLGAMNEYGFVYEIEKVRLHIFQPRKDSISVYETTAAELQKFGEEIKKHAKNALGKNPRMKAGEHCKFCPHAGHCPELAHTCLDRMTEDATLAPDPYELSPEALSYILNAEAMLSGWLKAVKTTALQDLMNGQEIPGYKVVEGKQGNRAWTDELAVAAALDAAGVAREDYTTVQLLSPAAMDKALGKKRAAELLTDLITRSPGAPTVVPESDKRPKLDRVAQAKEDFKEE